MAEFSFVAPIQPGKTDAWRKAVDEIKGSRNAAYKESRRQHGIKREHVSLQSTPMGDLIVVHMDAPDQQQVMRFRQRAQLLQELIGCRPDPGFALDRLQHHGGGPVGDQPLD